ncbi:MAG: SDR family oxidoreductase [Candidatus Buchananbacteria bacterium]
MTTLKDKVVIITGASRGIGSVIAKVLAGQGAKVVLTARNGEKLNLVATDIIKNGGQAISLICDVTKSQQVDELIKKVLAKWGQIDILINNAGVVVRKKIADTSEQDWDTVMAVNLKGVYLFSKHALPHLLKRQGIIINISSVVGKIGRAMYSAYATTKYGVLGFTDSLAKEVALEKVRVMAVCPSGINTETHRQIYPEVKAAQLMSPAVVADQILVMVENEQQYPNGTVVDILNKKNSK